MVSKQAIKSILRTFCYFPRTRMLRMMGVLLETNRKQTIDAVIELHWEGMGYVHKKE